MEDVICRNCGSINDYRTTQAGPHIKATCNGCDKYIKFLPQTKTNAMAEDKKEVFAEGISLFNPHDNAPDFVVGTLVITPRKLVDWLKAEGKDYLVDYKEEKQIKLQLKISKNDRLYATVDTYKPEAKAEGKRPPRPGGAKDDGTAPAGAPPPADDDLPF